MFESLRCVLAEPGWASSAHGLVALRRIDSGSDSLVVAGQHLLIGGWPCGTAAALSRGLSVRLFAKQGFSVTQSPALSAHVHNVEGQVSAAKYNQRYQRVPQRWIVLPT